LSDSFNPCIIGTGGIGTGFLFTTNENQTLGRNESRLAYLSDAKDYCKQHIVLHYASTLTLNKARVYPIGCVGCDVYGDQLLQEIAQAGMKVDYIARDPKTPTTLSFCLQYLDKDGCNITSSNGASGGVTPVSVQNAINGIGIDERTLVVAIPEVSIDARLELLRQGKLRGAFCAASITETEAARFLEEGAFQYIDLLAVNHHEALALAPGADDCHALGSRLYAKLQHFNEKIRLVVTCGGAGAETFENGRQEHIPILTSKVVNTTGAGDAFFGGTLAALSLGLPLQKGRNDESFGETVLESAAEVGALCAGLAVESIDSIAREVTRSNLRLFISERKWQQSPEFSLFLADE
jgi:sugar/nucleoside kinase (ribokinase family)